MAKKKKNDKSVPAAPQAPASVPTVNSVAAAPVVRGAAPAARSDATPTGTAAAGSTQAAPAPARTLATADVSTRAHEIWIARGRPSPGSPLEDWLQAERELGVRKS